MRIARFRTGGGKAMYGRIIDEQSALPLSGGLFDGDLRFSEVPIEIARLLPPVDPPNIIAIGLNYRRHAEETKAPLPNAPLIFLKATTALLAPHDAIRLPLSAPAEVDYEAELAIVIGRTARRVPEEHALDYVLGYTCANDVSARDCQKKLDKQWARGKSFDTFCPLGPWLVTRDELNPERARIRSRLNGKIMQESSTADLIFSCRKLISYVSHQFTLPAGTIILTGTPEGVGMARTPPVYLRDGDVIEVEIDGIGTLRNPVAREEESAT